MSAVKTYICTLFVIAGLLAGSNGKKFGFKTCSGDYGKSSALVTMTYFEGDTMIECQVQGTLADSQEFSCNSEDTSGTYVQRTECSPQSGFQAQYGLQISVPFDNKNDEDDVCIDEIYIGDDVIDVAAESVGDYYAANGNVQDYNYRYYDLPYLQTGDSAPSTASGSIVTGIPRCISQGSTRSFGFRTCTTDYWSYSMTDEEFTFTYYEGYSMWECTTNAAGNADGGEILTCSSSTRCVSSEEKYGIRITMSDVDSGNDADTCVDGLYINGNLIDVWGYWSGTGAFYNYIGDAWGESGSLFIERYSRYFQLDKSGTDYLPKVIDWEGDAGDSTVPECNTADPTPAPTSNPTSAPIEPIPTGIVFTVTGQLSAGSSNKLGIAIERTEYEDLGGGSMAGKTATYYISITPTGSVIVCDTGYECSTSVDTVSINLAADITISVIIGSLSATTYHVIVNGAVVVSNRAFNSPANYFRDGVNQIGIYMTGNSDASEVTCTGFDGNLLCDRDLVTDPRWGETLWDKDWPRFDMPWYTWTVNDPVCTIARTTNSDPLRFYVNDIPDYSGSDVGYPMDFDHPETYLIDLSSAWVKTLAALLCIVLVFNCYIICKNCNTSNQGKVLFMKAGRKSGYSKVNVESEYDSEAQMIRNEDE